MLADGRRDDIRPGLQLLDDGDRQGPPSYRDVSM